MSHQQYPHKLQLCIAPCVIRVLHCAVVICAYFAFTFCISFFYGDVTPKIFTFVWILYCTFRNQSAAVCSCDMRIFCTYIVVMNLKLHQKYAHFLQLYRTLRNQSASVCSYDMRICTGPLWGQSGKKDIRRKLF